MKDKITPSNEPEIKPETVFEVGAEGGAIRIFRQRNGSIDKFILKHNECYPTDEVPSVSVKEEYETFNQAFQYIERYAWYGLYIVFVHKDFRDFITEKLKDKLKEKSSVPDELLNSEDLYYIEEIKENLSRFSTD